MSGPTHPPSSLTPPSSNPLCSSLQRLSLYCESMQCSSIKMGCQTEEALKLVEASGGSISVATSSLQHAIEHAPTPT